MKEPDFISSILERVPELDVEYAVEAMGGVKSLYEKTLTHMARQIPFNIEGMDSSLIVSGDVEAFAVKVHGIKSALRHVGNMALGNAAEALEKAAKAGDKAYCAGHYGAFREELMRFYNQINEVIQPDAEGAGLEAANAGNISDFINALKQAREAADMCDSMSAYEILLPFTKMNFGGDTDNLVLKAANLLDQFKPFEALEYIAELLNEWDKPQL